MCGSLRPLQGLRVLSRCKPQAGVFVSSAGGLPQCGTVDAHVHVLIIICPQTGFDTLSLHACTLGARNGEWIPDTHVPTRHKYQASRGFEPRSLNSGSRVTVAPRGHAYTVRGRVHKAVLCWVS